MVVGHFHESDAEGDHFRAIGIKWAQYPALPVAVPAPFQIPMLTAALTELIRQQKVQTSERIAGQIKRISDELARCEVC